MKFRSMADTRYQSSDSSHSEAADVRIFPTSFAQQRLWFLEQLDPGGTHYNISMVRRLIGPLDVAALEKAIHDIIRRHAILRTHFEKQDGQPVQVLSRIDLPPLMFVDLTGLRPQERTATMEVILREDARRPHDLGRAPLLRSKLLRLAEQEHVLLLDMHHIVSDGWSMGIFRQEISQLYRAHRHGEPPPLPELSIQYVDFTLWQRNWLKGEVLDGLLHYWKHQLADPTALELPTDRPRPAVLGYRGAQHPVTLSPALTAALQGIGRSEGATLFMTTLTLFTILLAQYSEQRDIMVGTPNAGRNRTELEHLIGFFVNTLVLRVDLSGDPSFREALVRVRDTCLAAYEHQDLPFERLVEELQVARDRSRHPLFQVVFTLENASNRPLELEDLTVEPVELQAEIAKFDLTLTLTEGPDGLSGFFEYSTDLFNETTVARMAESFVALAESAVEDSQRPMGRHPGPTQAGRRSVLGVWDHATPAFPADRSSLELVEQWNATTTDYPRDCCVHELFADQARLSPDAVALVFGEQRMNYDALNARSNQLAHYLRRLGVGPDLPVGVYLDRSPEMVISVLGAMKAGGAYLPLDPAYPRERIGFMLEDSGAPVVLTVASMLEKLPEYDGRLLCMDRERSSIEQMRTDDPVNQTRPDQLSNIIYTSGSTGLPKGVEVLHRGVTRLVLGNSYMRFGADEVFLQMAPLSFDASTFELWGALLHGAACVLFPDRIPSTSALADVISRHGVTTLWLTASLFNAIIDEAPQVLSGIRQLLIGGEALSPAHVRRALALLPRTCLINGYGPTESTTFACCYTIPRTLDPDLTSVPIGSPIRNTRVYVLNARMRPVAIGAAGELYIGGDGLARGYRNRPELTAERFVPDPFSTDPSARFYRTGDLARFLPDGNIEFLGRLDQQVKIRGYRIDSGEIEVQLARHPAVRRAAVFAREDRSGERRLVAYLVPTGTDISAVALREHLSERLPEHMIPGAFVFLDSFPLTPNGKLDRSALPAPEPASPLSESRVAPRSSVEEWMAETWKGLLGVKCAGIHDNFFRLGGHSLLAVRLMERIRKQYQLDLPLAILFQAGTIASISKIIHENYQLGPWSPLVPIQPEGSNPPLFCVHPAGGNVLGFADFSRHLGGDYPVYGLQACGVIEGQEPHTCLRTMASFYIAAIREVQPQGPYCLGGVSFGGIVAYEMAVQLQAAGQQVAMLFIGDTWLRRGPHYRRLRYALHVPRLVHALGYRNTMRLLVGKLSGRRNFAVLGNQEPYANELHRRKMEAHMLAMREYFPGVYPGKVILFRNKDSSRFTQVLERYFGGPEMGWNELALDGVELYWLPGTHDDMFYGDNAAYFAARIKECMERALPRDEVQA